MSNLLELRGLEADISGSRILRGVTLDIGPSEVVALMGRNGVGKTTTLKTITGLLEVRAGTITFAGQRIDQLSTDARARLGIGYVPQGREIFPRLSVEENLRLPCEVLGLTELEMQERLSHAICRGQGVAALASSARQTRERQEGREDGCMLGCKVGCLEGRQDGCDDGCIEGRDEGERTHAGSGRTALDQ